MSSTASHTTSQWQGNTRWRRYGLLGGLGIVGAAIFTVLIIAGQVRIAITLMLGGLLVTLAMIRIQTAVIATLVYLILMGDLRRLLIPITGWSGQDPLLLIGPAFAIVVCAYVWASDRVRMDTSLARWILALMGVMALQMLNPAQGGLMVGVAGALFYIVPLLWFWIGRAYATPAFMKTLLYKVVVPLAVGAALMGYYQSFYGYLPHQMLWYEVSGGYTALGPKDALAAISFFSSSAEFSSFLIVIIMLLWAVVLCQKDYRMLGLIFFFLVGVFLVGSRGPIVKVLVAGSALWAILGKDASTWIARGTVALLIGVAALIFVLPRVSGIGASARVQHRIDRQTEGLLNPMDERKSTATGHFSRMIYGFTVGLKEPLGRGLGATTKAASKYGGNVSTTEIDISDIFVATGLIGGGIYVVIIFLIFFTACRYWLRTRSFLAMGLLGVLLVTFLTWLNGGQYAVCPLLWVCIGALDGLYHRHEDEHNVEVQEQG